MAHAESPPDSSHSVEEEAPVVGKHAEHLSVNQTSQALLIEDTEVTELQRSVHSTNASTKTEPEQQCCGWLRRRCPCPPHGLLSSLITKVSLATVLFGVVWSITQDECLPGGNLFGIITVFICSLTGGKLVGLVRLPHLPRLPPLLGMLLAGLLLRNIPVVTKAVYIDFRWSASLRNIALAVILIRAGLGLDASALKKLKAVCLRVAVGPCLIECSTVALLSHFLMGLPWIWGFILGFVLGAVSPAVVIPCMLLLQKDGYGVEQGVPTLLMAAGSFDDVLAITGFSTCLGIAFATGSTWFNIVRGVLEVLGGVVVGMALGFFLRYFPSKDEKALVLKRFFLLLGLSVFAVFGSNVVGFPGSGGLCTLVLSFLAGISWTKNKAPVEELVGEVWNVFQPLLFGLIGAEISIRVLEPITVGLGLAVLSIALAVRIFITFIMVLGAGFNFKEKIFICLAWMPKATVQAVIGSTALDMARMKQDDELQHFGMDVLSVAVLSILITAPLGALLIGLCGPRLLRRPENPEWAVGQGTLSPSDALVTDESAI